MYQLLFLGAAALFFLAALSPYARRYYERCFWPVIRPPRVDLLLNTLVVGTVGVAVAIFYAGAGGSLSLVFFARADSADALYTGAVTGSFAFGAARLLALTESQRFARSLYTVSILAASVFLAMGIVRPDLWTEITDNVLKLGKDDRSILPFAGVATLCAVVIPELLVRASERLVSEPPEVPFSLIREQLESFEKYRRFGDQSRVVAEMASAMRRALVHTEQNGTLDVCWHTANGAGGIRAIIEEFADRAIRERKVLNVRVVCNDSPQCRENMSGFHAGAVKFLKASGHQRMFIVGRQAALLGVQLGGGRQALWPDYAVLIEEPERIAQLRPIFDECWNAAKP